MRRENTLVHVLIHQQVLSYWTRCQPSVDPSRIILISSFVIFREFVSIVIAGGERSVRGREERRGRATQDTQNSIPLLPLHSSLSILSSYIHVLLLFSLCSLISFIHLSLAHSRIRFPQGVLQLLQVKARRREGEKERRREAEKQRSREAEKQR